MSTIDNLLDRIEIPRVVRVKQEFERPVVENIEETLEKELYKDELIKRIKPGMEIAVTVGSRGISNLPLLVKTLIKVIKDVGGKPFIIPAMGSHAGAVAEGQREMLISFGITEEYVGAPIRATMETVQIGTSDNGLPVRIDKYAYEADGIILLNRVKPHVAFRGPFESGLMKMIAIGLGKQEGADICHELGFGKMAENIPAIGREALKKANILFGVAVLENAYHETCEIRVLANEEIEEVEPGLQQRAKDLSPGIFFKDLDVMVMDEIGKDISGTGFDTNVVGRYHTPYASGGPDITRIAVLDITDVSHGNGNGLGIVDFTTDRAFQKFNFEQTYPNSLTSTVPVSVKIPMVLKSDRQAIQAAIKTCNILDKSKVRLIRIKNTIALGEIEVSENLIEEVNKNPYQKVISEPYELDFDEKGSLL